MDLSFAARFAERRTLVPRADDDLLGDLRSGEIEMDVGAGQSSLQVTASGENGFIEPERWRAVTDRPLLRPRPCCLDLLAATDDF